MKRISIFILVTSMLFFSTACNSSVGTEQTSWTAISTTKPTTIPEPSPMQFTGLGDDVSPKFMLEEGITVVTLSHDGTSNFQIELLNSTGDFVDLLVNEIGAFNGSLALGVHNGNIMGPEPGIHVLNITADGNWTILIKQPRPTSAQITPLYFVGKGCTVSDFFTLNEGLATFSITHDGNSNFQIEMLSINGEVEEYLVNEIGSYTGKKAIGVKRGNFMGTTPGIHLLTITADGYWTVTITE